jgi:hypothetical protein
LLPHLRLLKEWAKGHGDRGRRRPLLAAAPRLEAMGKRARL